MILIDKSKTEKRKKGNDCRRANFPDLGINRSNCHPDFYFCFEIRKQFDFICLFIHLRIHRNNVISRLLHQPNKVLLLQKVFDLL